MAAPDAEMKYGEYFGFTYSWIVLNRPHYVAWARTQPDPENQLTELIRFADNANGQGIPTVTLLADINNDKISLGQFKGKTFAWIMIHAPTYIDFAAQFVPRCSTEFFRLIQWARYDGSEAFEAEWAPLRQQHIAWMHERQRADLP